MGIRVTFQIFSKLLVMYIGKMIWICVYSLKTVVKVKKIMLFSGLEPSYLQIPHFFIRIGKDHLLSHRMGQSHRPGEDRRQEDMI